MLFRFGRVSRVCFAAALLLLPLCLTACGEKAPEQGAGEDASLAHTHAWEPANCTRGELCWSCGETKGDALGHTWEEATCIDAKRCSRCGVTEGASLGGHLNQEGTCSRCGEELSAVAKVNGRCALDLANPYAPNLVVYGGVIFEFPLKSKDSQVLGGYPTEFIISDQNGNEVARGSWPKNPPDILGKTEDGKWIWNRLTRTDFVPLAPGTYTATFYFYDRVRTDTDPYITEDSVCVPAGDFKTGRCTLIVK